MLAFASTIANTQPATSQKSQKTLKKSPSLKAKTKTKVVLGKALGNTPTVKALASRLSAQHQLPKAWVQQKIASARLLPQVQQMVLPHKLSSTRNSQQQAE